METVHCDPDQFRQACSRFPTGVTVTTVMGKDGLPQGLTVSSFTSVSLNPPIVLVCIDQRSHVLSELRVDQCFGINVLGIVQQELSIRFSRKKVDRFSDVSWYSGVTGAPLLVDASAVFECRTAALLPAGDHVIVIGLVLQVASNENEPLAYFNRCYGKVAASNS